MRVFQLLQFWLPAVLPRGVIAIIVQLIRGEADSD